MPSASHPFFEAVGDILCQAETTQQKALHLAACTTADSLAAGGMVHVFGTGHSHLLAEDVFFRAGGLVQINAILDPGLMLHVSALHSTDLERLEGYAAIVLDRYDLRPGDILVVISNSGRNAVPIEAASYAQNKGLKVIALTSVAAYGEVSVRHSTGRRLSEVADIVIDTCVPKGDALLHIDGIPQAMGPASTIVGATLIQAYLYDTVKELLARGDIPQILVSANADEPQDLSGIYATHANRIRHM